MKKRFTQLMAALALLVFMMPTMAGWGQTKDLEVFYTMNCPNNSSNTAYATYYDVVINGMTWNAPGNQNAFTNGWRIGGSKGTSVVREIKGKSAMNSAISKVVINHNGVNNSNLTINSVSLTVASNASFTEVIETKVINNPTVSSSGQLVFEPTANEWMTNSYYKITINYTHSQSKNCGLDVTSVVYYKETIPSGPVTLSAPTLTATPGNGQVSVSWNAVSNASSYTLCWADNASFTDAIEIENATSPEVINLTNGTTYYFKAKSIGDETSYTTSEWSETVVATPSNLATITINRNSLTSIGSYNLYPWVSGGVSGHVYATNNTSEIQTKKYDSGNVYNETMIPGTIKSIRVVKSSGNDVTWALKVDNSIIDNKENGVAMGEEQAVGSEGATWTVTGDYSYFNLYVTGSYTSYIASIEIKYEPKTQYDVNVTDLSATYGTITATPTSAIEGATVSLSVSPNSNYRFDSFVVTNAITSELITVTSTGTSTGTFTMPASAVNVTGTFTRLYTVTIASGIEHGTVTAEPLIAAEGEEITLTAEPAQHYEFGSWQVSYGQDGIIEPVNNKFNMPAENVTVSATFTQKVYTITYSVNGNTHQIPAVQVPGGNTIGAFPANPVCGDYSFLGWSSIESGTGYPSYVSTSYVPTADMTLYAVFGTTSETSLTITGSTSGIPTAYATTSWSINNEQYFGCYNIIQGQYSTNNKWIQFKADGGYLYNVKDFGKIVSIVVTYYTGTESNTNRDIAIRINDEVCNAADAGEVMSVSNSGDTYTFTYDNANKNYHYFRIYNSNTLNKLSSIKINYEAISPVAMTVTRIGDTQTLTENIPATQFVVVQSGGALTFTGTNTNPANLVIEDGGQLYVPAAGKGGNRDGVAATMQKSITAYTSDAEGWNFIASPITSSLTTDDVVGLVTTATYDLYKYNESDHMWHNYKENTDPELPNAAAGFAIAPQTGYLYANSVGTTISFEGTVQTGDALTINDLSYNESAGALAGFNLVGNPFTYAAYANKPYYMTSDYDGETHLVAVDSYWNTAVMPCTGVVVKATSSDKAVTFSKTAPEEPAEANQGSLQLTLAQQATNRGAATTIDNAIVSFNEGSELPKFYFMQQNANLYIPQGTEEYAIVSSNSQGEMPVNFKANEDGQYTLTVNPEGVEMNYLHLIDNMTGADIDLLALRQAQGPASYTFNAKTTDYESRFRLVFAASNEDGPSTGSGTFAFFSNGSWIITNPSTGSGTGEATLQVIDINGRILSSETINGSVSKSINATTGIYMMRLISGDNVKTQKVVVR